MEPFHDKKQHPFESTALTAAFNRYRNAKFHTRKKSKSISFVTPVLRGEANLEKIERIFMDKMIPKPSKKWSLVKCAARCLMMTDLIKSG